MKCSRCDKEAVIDDLCLDCFMTEAVEGEDYIRHESGVVVVQVGNCARVFGELVGLGF